MTKAQMLDLRDEINDVVENLTTIFSGVEQDDIKVVQPGMKALRELAAFAGKLDEMSLGGM